MTSEPKTTGRRILTGIVVSDKMDKTITVEVTRVVKDQRYGKYLHRTRTFKAHDEKNDCKVNDTVVIEESRPLSKTKRWTVIERRPSTTVPMIEVPLGTSAIAE